MNPDLEKRVPREILAELIEEVNRSLLEESWRSCSTWPCQLERSRVSGSGSVRENSQSARLSETDSKASGFRLEWE